MGRRKAGFGIFVRFGIVSAGAFLLSIAANAQALKLAYLGQWMIVSAQMAPWAHSGDKPYAPDIKALIGKALTFAAKNIRAPRPLGCSGVEYKVDMYSPDMLFEGGLTEPGKQAASLGFHSGTVPTLISGCEIEFHFVDANTALFALNNSIYRMERKANP